MKRATAIAVSVLTVVTFAFAQVAFAPVAADAQGTTAGGLTVPITATATPTGGTGTAIPGTFTIQQFVRSTDPANTTGIDAVGTATFNTAGVVQGSGIQTAQVRVPVKSITTAALSTAGPTVQQVGACDILHLELGPLHLDLLGLVIDLSEIELDIVAQPGAGNLLGNLLCAIAGLLDPQGGPLTNLLNQIIGLLNQLIGILG